MELALEGVRPGDADWQYARVNLLQRDADNHVIAAALLYRGEGTQAHVKVKGVYGLYDQSVHTALIVSLNRASGVLQVKDLHVIPLDESALFNILYHIQLSLWALYAITLAVWLVSNGPRMARVCLLLVAIAGEILLLAPDVPGSISHQSRLWVDQLQQLAIDQLRGSRDDASASATAPTAIDKRGKDEPISASAQVLPKPAGHLAQPFIERQAESAHQEDWRDQLHRLPSDKIGHILLFALLTLNTLWARGEWPMRHTVVVLFIYAIVAEQLQHFTLTRSLDWVDIAFNVIGSAVVLIPAWIIHISRSDQRPSTYTTN